LLKPCWLECGGLGALINPLLESSMSNQTKFAIDQVYAVILAAGKSARMGQPKQLLEWQNRALLEHALINARMVFEDRLLVVLGAEAELIQSTINLAGATVIVNPDWQTGMASSIRAAIRALPNSATAVMLMLCDQPLITNVQLQSLVSTWQATPEQIAASEYHQSIGVPAIFPASYFDQLSMLAGDKGAKSVLIKHQTDLIRISLPEAEFDIDTLADFQHLHQY
jgi:molybdenum cofactor cytidylyltransferase